MRQFSREFCNRLVCLAIWLAIVFPITVGEDLGNLLPVAQENIVGVAGLVDLDSCLICGRQEAEQS